MKPRVLSSRKQPAPVSPVCLTLLSLVDRDLFFQCPKGRRSRQGPNPVGLHLDALKDGAVEGRPNAVGLHLDALKDGALEGRPNAVGLQLDALRDMGLPPLAALTRGGLPQASVLALRAARGRGGDTVSDSSQGGREIGRAL